MHMSGQLPCSSLIFLSYDFLAVFGDLWHSWILLVKLKHYWLESLRRQVDLFRLLHDLLCDELRLGRSSELQGPYTLLLVHVYFVMAEAGFTHKDLIFIFSGHLLDKIELGYMFGLWKRLREMIQILEPMLVSFVHWERRPLGLLVEVDEACGAWLDHRLVKRIHCAVDTSFKAMIVEGSLSFSLLALNFQRSEPAWAFKSILIV